MKPGQRPTSRDSFKHRSLAPRFRDAFHGIYEAYREEPNLRFHTFAASCVAVGGYAVSAQGWEAAYLAITIMTALSAEMVNTAVERAVDLAAEGRRHPLAGQAKQVAAGVVLLTALHATFAAYFVFVYNRGVMETVLAVWHLAARQPWSMALPLLAAVLGLLGGAKGTR